MHKNSFFWEKASRKRTKTRFTLLLLEYGEYFVDDVGVFQFPNPDDGSGRDFFQCDALKVQGRLKLCTKSLIFEPADGRRPLVKFPFKHMSASVGEYGLTPSQRSQCTIETSGFFSFSCSPVFEMKEEGKIGPYKQVDGADPREKTEYFFAVSHSHIGVLLTKISQLRQIYAANERGELDTVSHLLADLTSAGPTATFDASKLIDFHEKLQMEMAIGAKKIKPLVDNPGYIMLTNRRLYFQPGELNNVGEATQHYNLADICRLYKRRYLLMDTALELIMADGESVLFCFDGTSNRDYIHDVVNAEPHLENSRITLNEMTEKWRRREVSNFDYLMFLNNEAGRSLSDLAQYPVYPHVLADYTSKSLDLSRPETFRDLSKPIGALNQQRLQFFKERMLSMPPEDAELGVPPRFLYGTHYSTPGYVLYYLVRVAPEQMLCLQSGKFDSTDRMFISLADTWESCLNNPADLKELIPEFYCGKSGEFLVNMAELDLGRRQTGERLHDVELPPWAKSPKDFIKKHTKALESEYVSDHLNEWIDLIFGVYQRGELALEHDNLFYHLTYEGAVDMESITDARERRALEVQIQEFGQTPRQLFSGPHPQRLPLGETTVLKETPPSAVGLRPVLATSKATPPHRSVAEKGLIYVPPTEKHAAIDVPPTPLEASAAASPPPLSTEAEEASIDGEDETPAEGPKEVIALGKDFQEEVERVLQEEHDDANFVDDGPRYTDALKKPSHIIDKSAGKSKGSTSLYFSSWVGSKIGNLWGAAVGTTTRENESQDSQELGEKVKLDDCTRVTELPVKAEGVTMGNNLSPQSTRNTFALADVSPGVPKRIAEDIEMHSSDPFQAHSEPLTSLSLSVDGKTATTCSKDSSMKVLRVSFLEQAGAMSRAWIQISVRRSFAASDPPLSGCCLLPDFTHGNVTDAAKFVLVSSWDSSIYSYSIPNACVVGSKIAHDDGVSALDCDARSRRVVSGSWDASVKVWGVSPSTGLLSSVPEAEFFDHDTPIQCVAVDATGRLVAAGAEDGRVCVWSVAKGGNLLVQRQISASGSMSFYTRTITGVQWVEHGSDTFLICCSIDGSIVCMRPTDAACTLIAVGQFDSGLKCIQCDLLGRLGGDTGLAVFAGFADGSVRLFSICDNSFVQLCKHTSVHAGGTNALSMSASGTVLASGGEDGCVRVWELRTSS